MSEFQLEKLEDRMMLSLSTDLTFGDQGTSQFVEPFVIDVNERLEDLATDENGRTYVAGGYNLDAFMSRFLPSGELDRSFGFEGTMYFRGGPQGRGTLDREFTKIDIASDGSIVGLLEDFESVAAIKSKYLGRFSVSGSGFQTLYAELEDLIDLDVEKEDQVVFLAPELLGRDIKLRRFTLDGVETLNVNFSETENPRRIAVQSDGNILVAFERNDEVHLQRLNSDGTIDNSFGNSGTLVITQLSKVTDLSVDANDRIIIAGNIESGSSTIHRVIGVTSTGSIDAQFANNGIFTDGRIRSIVDVKFDTFGRIRVAGKAANSTGDQVDAVVGILQNGSLQTNFGTNGIIFDRADNLKVKFDLSNENKILFGESKSIGRYHPNGSEDRTFDVDGRVDGVEFFDFVQQFPRGVQLLKDGGSIVTVERNGEFVLLKLDSEGQLDESYGESGTATIPLKNTRFLKTRVDEKDRVVILERRPNGTFLYRFTTEGKLDETFGGDGIVKALGNEVDDLTRIAPQSIAFANNRIFLLSGASEAINEFRFDRFVTLFGFLENGQRDQNFGVNGISSLKLSEFVNSRNGTFVPLDLQVDSTGRMLAVGYESFFTEKDGTFYDLSIRRFKLDGSVDTQFRKIERNMLSNPPSVILSVGREQTIVSYSDVIFGFSSDGTRTFNKQDRFRNLDQLVQLPDGRFYSFDSRNSSQYSTVHRHLANGELDTTFDDDGIVRFDFPALEFAKTTESGEILVAGFGAIRGSGSKTSGLYKRVSEFETVYEVGDQLIISGTSGDDIIRLTRSNNQLIATINFDSKPAEQFTFSIPNEIVIYGFNGDDRIIIGSGLAVEMLVYAGEGDDFVQTGNLSDEVFGGGGDDRIFTSIGNDKVIDPRGDNFVDLGKGNDVAETGSGNDRVLGGDGQDTIRTGGGNDQAEGGNGNDQLFGGNGDDRLNGRGGDDFVFGGPGNDQLFGAVGNDVLVGGIGNDRLRGENGFDILIGGVGSDQLFGGSGSDLLIGVRTKFDNSLEDLTLIRNRWKNSQTYSQKLQAIRGGINGTEVKLVFDDTVIPVNGDKDKLEGGGSRDWFFFQQGNGSLVDLESNEEVDH